MSNNDYKFYPHEYSERESEIIQELAKADDILSREKNRRGEIFVGHIIGGSGGDRKKEVEGQFIKINDLHGPTRWISEKGILDCIEERIRSDVRGIFLRGQALLYETLVSAGTPYRDICEEGKLQCNIVLYGNNDHMTWHRDDVTIRNQDQEQEYVALDTTFYPASVTLVLIDNVVSKNDWKDLGFACIWPEQSGHTLFLCSDGPGGQSEIRPDWDSFERDVKSVREKYHPVKILSNIEVHGGKDVPPCERSKGWHCISGNAYRYGLHRPLTRLRASSSQESNASDRQSTSGIRRVSFNFRLVRKTTWRLVTKW